MALKDYYSILDLPPGSSVGDVKKAYRNLVMRYHPDKNPDNPYAVAHFQEIREAYEVLSHPEKREEYHLQRGYWKSTGKAFAESEAITPQRIILQARWLSEGLARIDVFRMDAGALQYQILEILSDSTINQLETFGDGSANELIVHYLLSAAALLSWKLVTPVTTRLERVAGENRDALEKIAVFKKGKQREHYVNVYRIPVLVLITLLICYLIYRLS